MLSEYVLLSGIFLLSEGFLVILMFIFLCFSILQYINKAFITYSRGLAYGVEISSQFFFLLFFVYLLILSCSFNNKKVFLAFFSLYNDDFITMSKIFVVLFVLVLIIICCNYLKTDLILKSYEFFSIFVLSILGMLVLISSADLVTLYLALELQSLSFYVLAGYKQNSLFSIESALKYFVLGTIASGFLLFSSSMIYATTGIFRFSEIGLFLQTSEETVLVKFLAFFIIFFLTPFLFKLSAAPFHIWTPDVYEGAPTVITMFFSVVPKIIFLSLLIRFCFEIFFVFSYNWKIFLYYTSLFSFLIGTFAALFQYKIKRMLAYSTISHVGFLLASIFCSTVEGFAVSILYFLVYGFSVIGVFTNLIYVRYYSNFLKIKNIFEYNSFLNFNVLLSLTLLINFFSFVGIPPLAGFFAKLYVFLNLLQTENYMLFIISIISSVVSAYFYLRIVKIIFFRKVVQFLFFTPIPVLGSFVIVLTLLFSIFFCLNIEFFFRLFYNITFQSFLFSHPLNTLF